MVGLGAGSTSPCTLLVVSLLVLGPLAHCQFVLPSKWPTNAGRNTQDLIGALPGLSWAPGFDSFSGYLKGIDGHLLHYWMVESQSQPASDPLIFWSVETFPTGPFRRTVCMITIPDC